MVTGQARVLQQHDPRKVRVVYERERYHDAWLHNPRIAQRGEKGDFQTLAARDRYLRPYVASKSSNHWTWRRYGPPKGELYFTADESAYGEQYSGRVILEPHIKPGASPNKEWGWVRWNKLAWLLQRRGFRVTQLGPNGHQSLEGAERIYTPTMRHAAAIVARARAAALPEGGLHHVCAAVGTPAVVIFGGYIAPAVTGYEEQVNLFTGASKGYELGCGMRVHCSHCREAMARIAPEDVAERLMAILKAGAA